MERLQTLFTKYLNNEIDPDEFAELWQLMDEEQLNGQLGAQLQELWEKGPEHALNPADWDRKMAAMKKAQLPVTGRLMAWRPYVAAAVVFLALAAYWFIDLQLSGKEARIEAKRRLDEVMPGHNGAVLTLSNGQQVVLDSAGNGELVTDANVGILKKDGEIVYTGRSEEVVYNTVSTDKGRQWRLTLPDGTRVWLNAASSITYPLSFRGNERLVTMTGEAYFEVVHNAAQPFKVKVGNRVIEDIGTSFNVNAYADEKLLTATLLEGSVSIRTPETPEHVIMSGNGKQAQINPSGKIAVRSDADTEDVMAWKNGMFSFNQSDIEGIMRQISRWYDLDILYTGARSKETFSGMVSRSSNLSQVLKIMEQASIRFRLEGKTLVVIQ